mgnify:CR=1 FL=1
MEDFEENLMEPRLAGREEEMSELSLRPKTLKEYIGQTKVKENMKVYIEAAKKRGESLDHVLLYGPPGLGKTTLSNIIANEMNVNIKIYGESKSKEIRNKYIDFFINKESPYYLNLIEKMENLIKENIKQ